MGFPTKNDHVGVFWGYHHLRKHPYIYIMTVVSQNLANKSLPYKSDTYINGSKWDDLSIPNLYMGVSNNRGTPKWMVYNGKPY